MPAVFLVKYSDFEYICGILITGLFGYIVELNFFKKMIRTLSTYESPSLSIIETLHSEVLCMSIPSDLETYDVEPELDW